MVILIVINHPLHRLNHHPNHLCFLHYCRFHIQFLKLNLCFFHKSINTKIVKKKMEKTTIILYYERGSRLNISKRISRRQGEWKINHQCFLKCFVVKSTWSFPVQPGLLNVRNRNITMTSISQNP